jgi:IclR family transcriptional regulator, pca regulon regulatory protein
LNAISRLPYRSTTSASNLTPMTPYTVTDKVLLLATIIIDRKKGYSLVDREAESGFRSIAVPIRRYDGTIAAAINMGARMSIASRPAK